MKGKTYGMPKGIPFLFRLAYEGERGGHAPPSGASPWTRLVEILFLLYYEQGQ
jgi:hypothetical protein